MITSLMSLGLTLLLSLQAVAQESNRDTPSAGDAETPAVRVERGARDVERPRPVRPRGVIPDQARPAGRPTFTLRRARPAGPDGRAGRAVAEPDRAVVPRVRAVQRQTLVLRLQHLPATDTFEVVSTWLKNQQSESDRLRATLVADALTNSLVVSGTAEQLNEIQRVVGDLDQPSPQIRLKALLAELALAEAPQPGMGATTASVVQGDIGEIIANLQQRGELRMLARPELLAADNQPAFLQLGHRVPRIVGTSVSRGGQSNNVQLENVGTILGVTGRVANEDTVTLEIDLERSHLGPEAEGTPVATAADGAVVRTPVIQSLTLQTTVSLRSGQTVLIGGMVYQTDQGWRELLLLLRPEIVR